MPEVRLHFHSLLDRHYILRRKDLGLVPGDLLGKSFVEEDDAHLQLMVVLAYRLDQEGH